MNKISVVNNLITNYKNLQAVCVCGFVCEINNAIVTFVNTVNKDEKF